MFFGYVLTYIILSPLYKVAPMSFPLHNFMHPPFCYQWW